MFKISDVAPDIAALAAEFERHKAECKADPCERCGRFPPSAPEPTMESTLEEAAVRCIPVAFRDVRLSTPWLARLIGAQSMQLASVSLAAPRIAFTGPPGAGKTTLAVAMFYAAGLAEAKRWTRARYLYVSAHSLAKARAMHPLGEGEAPLVEQALDAPLLLIDELGGEDTRYASAVAEVIYERHAADRPTWVTTGVGPRELASRYGGGIARRLFEGAVVFRLAGKR